VIGPCRVDARENGRNGNLPAIMRSSIVLRMSTIDITLDKAALDLAGVLRRLREVCYEAGWKIQRKRTVSF
jgi:hypothetical protein